MDDPKIIVLDTPTPWGSWRRGCKARVAKDCRVFFYAKVPFENCGRCEAEIARRKAAERAVWVDQNAPTPDLDPVTGVGTILTEKERFDTGWATPKWS